MADQQAEGDATYMCKQVNKRALGGIRPSPSEKERVGPSVESGLGLLTGSDWSNQSIIHLPDSPSLLDVAHSQNTINLMTRKKKVGVVLATYGTRWSGR